MLTKLSFVSIVVSLVLAAACSGNANKPNERADQAADAGVVATDGSTSAVIPPPPVIPKTPLGTTCGTNADCASGFCTDGVCCDSACTETCYACNQAAASGHCAPLSSGQDSNASATCTRPSACYLAKSGTVPVCKSADGTVCQSDADCVSGHCLTFYADADGDGFGGPDGTRFCSELNGAPPAGFAAYSGDCCDLDTGASPGFDSSQFLAMPDACGSFDWNCDGKQAQQRSCPTVVACGAPCNVNLGFFSYTAFTEACN